MADTTSTTPNTTTTPTDNSTNSSNPQKYEKEIKIWTGYTHYLLIVDGLLRTTNDICKQKIADAETYKKVAAAIFATHLALQGVDKEFLDGIKQMNAGQAPTYSFEPAPIPDWNPKPTSTDVFVGAWESIKGVLEEAMGKVEASSAMAVAISGLLNSGDKCVESLSAIFA